MDPDASRGADATVGHPAFTFPATDWDRTDWKVLAALTLVMGVIALWLYEPLTPSFFESIDLSGYIPIIRAHDPVDAFLVIQRGDWVAGRFAPLSYVGMVGKYFLFGERTVWWQLFTALQMLVNCALCYVMLRRLGADVAGSCAGTLVLFIGCSASYAWVRVHYGEAIALHFLLPALILAAGYRDSPRPFARGAAICALLAGVVLTKEPIIAVVPGVFLVAACVQRREWRLPALDRRVVGLAVAIAATCIVLLVPILLARAGARAGGYGANYNPARLSLKALLYYQHFMLFPTSITIRRPIPDVAFLVVVGTGLRLYWQRIDRRALLVFLVTALSFPVIGALVHSPWPTAYAHYPLPFQVGSALLLAYAVSALAMPGSRRVRVIATVAGVACVVFNLQFVHEKVRRTFAERHTQEALMHRLRAVVDSLPSPTPIISTSPWLRHQLPQHGQFVTGRPFTPGSGDSCDAVRDRESSARALVLAEVDECPALRALLGPPTITVVEEFRSMSAMLRPTVFRFGYDVWVPK